MFTWLPSGETSLREKPRDKLDFQKESVGYIENSSSGLPEALAKAEQAGPLSAESPTQNQHLHKKMQVGPPSCRHLRNSTQASDDPSAVKQLPHEVRVLVRAFRKPLGGYKLLQKIKRLKFGTRSWISS